MHYLTSALQFIGIQESGMNEIAIGLADGAIE
jgi:hypothetical protein